MEKVNGKYTGPIYTIDKREAVDKFAKAIAIVCGSATVISLGGVGVSYLNIDSQFMDALREGRKYLFGSAVGTGILTGLSSEVVKVRTDKTHLLKRVNGDYIEGPATNNKDSAAFEIEKRENQNQAYKKDAITSAIVFALSILGIGLAKIDGEDPSKFVEFFKKAGEEIFVGGAVASGISGILSVIRALKNSSESDEIRTVFNVDDTTSHKALSGDRSPETTDGYARILEAKAKKHSSSETPTEE